MASAQKTMMKKTHFKAEIDRRFPADESDALWQKATDQLAVLQKQYASLPKGVRFHTDNKILPAAAIYLTLKERVSQPEAYQIIEEATFKAASNAGNKLAAAMRIPGMRSLFMKAWDPLIRKVFGESSGFENIFYPKKKDEYRMDVIS